MLRFARNDNQGADGLLRFARNDDQGADGLLRFARNDSYNMEFKTYHTYIVTNKNHTVLYTGVTSALRNRIVQHKHKFYPHSFTAKYNAEELVYYEAFFDIGEAIAREKQLKGGSRQKKLDLINAFNPEWRDLFEDLD